MRSPVINIVTGKGGGGHYATYRALRSHLEARQARHQLVSYRFQITDMDDIMAQMSEQQGSLNAYKYLGSSVSELYNNMLERGWTWLWPLQMRLNKLLVRLNRDFAVNYFKHYWRSQQPDIVISVATMCNKVLWQALHETLPGTPYVTVMIDFADVPPGFWIEPETDSYLVCGKARAVEQAEQLGVKPERIVATSGMVIHPSFRPSVGRVAGQQARAQRRAERGLAADRLTGLVMFGGNGTDAMVEIARQLERFGDRLQLIFLCGRSQRLTQQIENLPGTQRRLAIGFTTEVSEYMALADFFIGKPGPGSLSEALAMHLPVITERNFFTLLHERYNADWIEQTGTGIVLSHFSQVGAAVEQFLNPAAFERYQAAARADNNRAVEEVGDLIESLLGVPAASNPATSQMVEVSE